LIKDAVEVTVVSPKYLYPYLFRRNLTMLTLKS